MTLAYAEPVILQAVNAACLKKPYFVTRQDLISEAWYIYVKACKFYVPRRTKRFENYLRFKLKKKLLDYIIKQRQLHHGLRRNGDPILKHATLPVFTYAYMHWTDELSEEALRVARLALQSRPELRPKEIRRSLRQYLSALGWTMREIAETFKEIGRAIR